MPAITSSNGFVYGETIEVRIETTVRENVELPSLSVTIQEARLLVIGGANLPLQMEAPQAGWRKASITVRFPANLAAAKYHITLKLMNGHTEETAQLIEKQVALLAFDTLPGNKDFLGFVDLGIAAVEGISCTERP
jgi:lipopolysaccharide transport system ATP-binding protein